MVLFAALGASGGAFADDASRCKSVDVLVRVSWNPERAERVSGVVTRLQYPRSLEIMTDAKDGSAKERVELLTGTSGGLFDALNKDTDGDGAGDLLNVGVITMGIKAGDFVRIHFACRPGQAPPASSDLRCVADVADQAGAVAATCSATIIAS